MSRILSAAAFLLAVSIPVSSLELSDYRIIDLSHAYNAETIYWPTSPSKFELTELAYGETPGGWFYSAYALCTPEHGGTHFDAPIRFHASGAPGHDVPLEDVIAPAVTIDVSAQAAGDPNHRLTVEDVLDFEARHGEIEAGMIVLLRTGWSERWPDTAAYMGDYGRRHAGRHEPAVVPRLWSGRGPAARRAERRRCSGHRHGVDRPRALPGFRGPRTRGSEQRRRPGEPDGPRPASPRASPCLRCR